MEATDNLQVRANGGAAHWACGRRSVDLGAVSEPYKSACLRRDQPVAASNPLVGDPARFIDEAVEFQ